MKKIMHQSLKMKWMLTTGLTIFISYAAICIVIFAALHSWILADEEKNAQRTIEDFSGFFASQGFAVTIQDLKNQTGLMKAILNQDQTVRFFQLDGTEILQINPTSSAAPLPSVITGGAVSEQKVDGRDAFVMHEVMQIGPTQIIVQLIHPLTAFQSMMRYIFTTMCILGVGGILFAVAISYYVSTWLIRPLQDLRNSMIAVKEGGFETKVNFVYKPQDEIGDLLNIYQEMLGRLEQSFERQQQFVSDASHELRTPIQALEGHLSLMKRWGKNDPDVLSESLETSLEEVARMKKMLEELLMLAREEQSNTVVAVNPVTVLTQIEEDMRFLYAHAHFKLQVVGQAHSLHITVEALGQIIRNLYENAIRYCEGAPVIQTTLHFNKQQALIEVRDNGIGISKQHLPFIFDRFYKVDDARVHVEGSTGLGLSITKMLVEKYNGTLDVQSEVGKGTVFVIRFPLKM